MTKLERKTEAVPRNGRRQAGPAVTSASGRSEQRQSLLILGMLTLLLTVVIVPKGGLVPDYYAPGDIASRDIKAPKDLLIPDQPLTEKKRLEAEEAVRPLYDFDPRTGREIGERLIKALERLQRGPVQDGANLRPEVEQLLGVELAEAELRGLQQVSATVFGSGGKEAPGPPPLLPQLRQAMAEGLEQMIVGNLQLFLADQQQGVKVRDLNGGGEALLEKPALVIGVGEARDQLATRFKEIPGLNAASRQALLDVLGKLIRPTLTFNRNETETRRQLAREEVKPVLFQVKKGEMIVRVGERVTEEQIRKLRSLREVGSDYGTLRNAAGLFLVIGALLAVTHAFASRSIRKYRPTTRDLWFLAGTLLSLFILIKVSIFISTALEGAFPYIDSTTYYYVFPFAVGAMLVRIVLNSEVALLFALTISLLLGALFGNSLVIALYALVGSVVGAHWVRHCKERSTLYYAGLRISLANVVMILGIHLLAGRGLEMQLVYKVAFGAAGGLLCAVIATGTIPLVEALFKYTTDIKLLELANLNRPVLRELMVRAPGTYHHSVIVGNLVEAAAEEINANPLLARVAAYYHDIGKIRKPLYFVENSGDKENRHDKLAPSMSALILMSHVKDGVELARENRLGTPLIDIIRQHHGTALIKFFFDKAKNQEKGVQQIDERDYRYPGPKPQTREAALIMLADAVEAASRTLTDPTPARIQGMVQKIINNIFIDGQLDECELTLKDLHRIAKSFNRILSGMFHHRIDYPEPAYKEREKEPARRKQSADTYREPPREPKDPGAEAPAGSIEDLKRLGMS